jgi:hypothetical protein
MRKFIKNVIKSGGQVAAFSNSALGRACMGLGLVVGASVSSFAAGAVTIPESGIDMAGYVTAAILAIGGVIAVVVGGYFAFLLIRKSMAWAGKALG